MTVKLAPNLIEAANRAEATALLLRLGYYVYRSEADVDGEDLVIREPGGKLTAVQLKSRMTVNWTKYGERGLSMLFPSAPWLRDHARDWYLVPHDELYLKLEQKHGSTKSFEARSWSSSSPSKDLLPWLLPFKLDR